MRLDWTGVLYIVWEFSTSIKSLGVDATGLWGGGDGGDTSFYRFALMPEIPKFLEIRKIPEIIYQNLINLIFSFDVNIIDTLIRRFLRVSAFVQYRCIKKVEI